MKSFLVVALGFILVGSGVSLVSAIHQDVQLSSQSRQPPVTSPLIVNHPAQASPSLILSDQFSIDGTRGRICTLWDSHQAMADRRGVNAGLIHVSFTANQSVHFWILNTSQYSEYESTTTCSAALKSPSILTLASRSDYSNGTIRIPRTDQYYFVFANPNDGGVRVSLVVDYPPTITTVSTFSKTVLNKQFILDGIKGKGTSVGCVSDYYDVSLEAGRLGVTYTATGPVDFSILNPSQYSRRMEQTSCENRQAVPAVFKYFDSEVYDGSVQFNSTNTYYFVFVNRSANPVYISVTVGYPKGEVTTRATPSANILQGLPINMSQLQQVLGALATGGSVVLGWLFKTRKRRFLSGYLTKIDYTYNQYATNRVECKKVLENMKAEILQMLKTGKIDEAHFTILEDKITQYLAEIR